MKKLLIIALQLIVSTHAFGQSNIKLGGMNEMPNALIQGNCPEYLNCETGEIQYFEYKKDMVVDAPEVCEPLGVKSLVLQKGRYEVNRTSKSGATVTILCKITFPPNRPRPNPNSYKIESTNPKGQDCKGYGNSCWYSTSLLDDKDQTMKLIITPIMENDACVALKITWPNAGSAAKGIQEKGLSNRVIKERNSKGTDPRNPGF
jgi:hypothetical protein